MTDIFDVPDDGTYDGLPPPGCDPQKDYEERPRSLTRVKSVFDELAAASDNSRPADVASAASFALNSIRLYAFDRSAPRIDPEHRDELLWLLMKAKNNISRSLSWRNKAVGQRDVDAAIEAVACQIVFWAEDEPWKTRPSDLRADVCDRARWLQNELHNVSLEIAIMDRQRVRTAIVVEQIKTRALAGDENAA